MRSIAFVVAALLSAPASHARTWHLTPDGSGDAPHLQAAVDAADALDVIELASGVYTGEGNRDVFVSKTLVFRSASGVAADCRIDCQGSAEENHRAFSMAADGEFRGLTVVNGHVSDKGGAIYALDAVGARIHDCVFADNTASAGGALAFDSLDLRRAFGPGEEDVRIENTSFLRNTAESSGAIYFLAVGVVFEDCRFLENVARGAGGVTSFVNAAPSFLGCLFAGNQAISGGAVECGDPARFDRCTFVRNAAERGAHVDTGNIDGSTEFLRCILAFAERGDAVRCAEGGFEVAMSCSDVFGNPGGDFTGCLSGMAGVDGNFSADPMFCDLAAGDYGLHEKSPCASKNAGACDRIGAFDVTCGISDGVEHLAWSRLKARYRTAPEASR